MSISQAPHAIQYNLTASILMTKIPSLVIQVTRSSVTLAIHLCNNWSVVKIPAQTTVDTDATTIIGNTMSAVASEFKKMREPKLAKLKGRITSGASLFFNSWVKDVRAVILERSMSNAELLQLVKDYTEGKSTPTGRILHSVYHQIHPLKASSTI